MFALTTKLLNGSGVTAVSHPVLVSLLELAAQKPGLKPDAVPDLHALRKRLERQWGAVCAGFRACVAVSASDADLLKVLPFAGLSYAEGVGWGITAEDLLSYRGLVADALVRLAGSKLHSLQSCPITSLAELRKAQKRNCMKSFAAPVHGAAGKVETGFIDGRGLVVSWPLFGLRVFSALVSDEFGQVTAIGHSDSKKKALLAFNKT